MHEIEITEIPPLKPNEQSLLAMHSLLNVFNVLRGELALIGLTLARDDALLKGGLALCDRWRQSLQNPVAALATAGEVEGGAAALFAEIEAALSARPEKCGDAEVAESRANLQSVFTILRVRAREELARARHPDRWEEFSASELRPDFHQCFAAIGKNSHGRFKVIFNAALQQAQDFCVDFKIESSAGDRLRMPAVFQDVFRDLIANARKYTAPGGHITAALYEDPEVLRWVVEDTGGGIPAAELAEVVHYGRRASNVGTVRTMGGGFGLTKAFLATKQFGGRFWIASEVGVGTWVRIHVPRPATAKPAA